VPHRAAMADSKSDTKDGSSANSSSSAGAGGGSSLRAEQWKMRGRLSLSSPSLHPLPRVWCAAGLCRLLE
jgi:hypothetical protein